MSVLAEILTKARTNNQAIGHFNISNLEMLRAVAMAAKEAGMPVMIGTSEGEAAFIGYRTAVGMVRAVAEEFGVLLFLNADHHKSVEAARRAVDAGYKSVHIDLSKLPYEENIAGTKRIVDYARASGRDVSVEGELGVLATESSKIYESAISIDPASFTTVEQAAEFVEKTGVNRFAPAVGNFHGISKVQEKKLDMDLIARIRSMIPEQVALVLHGGSGTPDADIREAIRAGIANVHVSTELRIAYSDALRKTFADNPEETTPYTLLSPAVESVKAVAVQKILLFGSQ